jgi:hypothetical protein
MACAHSHSYPGGWDGRSTWTQELEARLSNIGRLCLKEESIDNIREMQIKTVRNKVSGGPFSRQGI